MFENLISRYNGRTIEDDGPYKSAEFEDFAKRLRKEMKRNYKVPKFTIGHYDVSGIIKNENEGNDVFFSFSVPRGGFEPLDMRSTSAMAGILIRKSTPKDPLGKHSHNQFTNFYNFEEDVNEILNGSEAWW